MSVSITGPERTGGPKDGGESPPTRAAVRTGRLVVAAIVLAGVLGTLAVVRDAQTARPVIAVPAAQAPQSRPQTAAQARAAVLSFTPSGSTIPVRSAIAAATGNPPAHLGTVRVSRFGKGWAVTLTTRVQVATLRKKGWIYTGGGQGSSDPAHGLIDVTAGAVEYVVRFDPATRLAVYQFRLSSHATTLSAMNWNANSVVTQTSIGNNDLP